MQEMFNVKMDGDVADSHQVPAYLASKTIYGFSRSFLIITNLATEGRVRKKDYNLNLFQLNLLPPKKGSFELVYSVAYDPIFLGAVGTGILSSIIWDAMKFCGKKLGGQAAEIPESTEKLLEAANSSEERLLDALEPAVRESHHIINNGVINISINNGRDPEKLTYDRSTKDYVWQNVIDRTVQTKLFSVSKFDVTSGAGAAFDFEDKKPVNFQLDKSIDYESVQSALWSQSQYAKYKYNNEQMASTVAFKYTSINSIDGRKKKVFVSKIRKEINQL